MPDDPQPAQLWETMGARGGPRRGGEAVEMGEQEVERERPGRRRPYLLLRRGGAP